MYGGIIIEANDQQPEIIAKMDDSHNDNDRLSSISWTLIIGAAFDEFAFGMFGFILVVFLSSAYPDSLLLVSVYGLTNGLMMFFSGGPTGRFIDAGIANNRRLQSTILLLALQYICILACCALCYAFLRLKSDLWLPPIILLSGFVSLSRAASSISIENDWLVVISGSNTEYLSGLNVKLRRVHLIARMIAPATAGYCLKILDGQLNDIFVAMGGLSIMTFLIKYKCLKKICSLAPILVMQRTEEEEEEEECDEDDATQIEEQVHMEPKHCTSCSMIGGYVIYFQQKIAMGGLGFALLFLNVMSSGTIMTSYLIWRGLELSSLGLVRGASEIFGFIGTIAFEFASSSDRFALRTTTVLSIGFMALCLTISVCGTFFVPNDTSISLWMLILGVIFSRIGLWANDLSILKLTQRTVDESVRGIVGGSQSSMNSFFDLLHFILGACFSDPENFYVLCLIGYSAVITGFVLMLKGVYFSPAFWSI